MVNAFNPRTQRRERQVVSEFKARLVYTKFQHSQEYTKKP